MGTAFTCHTEISKTNSGKKGCHSGCVSWFGWWEVEPATKTAKNQGLLFYYTELPTVNTKHNCENKTVAMAGLKINNRTGSKCHHNELADLLS